MRTDPRLAKNEWNTTLDDIAFTAMRFLARSGES